MTDERKPLAPDRLPPFLLNVRAHPYAYLLSAEITMKEATSRPRKLRAFVIASTAERK